MSQPIKSLFEQYVDAYELFLQHVFQKGNNPTNILHEQIVSILTSYVTELDNDYLYSMCDTPISESSENLLSYDATYIKKTKYLAKMTELDLMNPKYPKYITFVNFQTIKRRKMINRFSSIIDNNCLNSKMCNAIFFFNSHVV